MKKEIYEQLGSELRQSESDIKLVESGNNNSQCPRCHSNKIVKRARVNGSQRFYCKDCKKYYTIKTKTAFENSNKPIEMWAKYIDLMCKKLSLREITKELDISLPTAFLWRHKILAALSSMKSEKLSGIVEADETYFRESQKGNKQLKRKSHKSGKSKLTHLQLRVFLGLTEEEYKASRLKRGLSNDQVCVLTAMDRKNNIFGKPAGYGKMKSNFLRIIKPQIDKKSTLITDGEPLYSTLQVAKHKKLEHGLSKDKVYNIGRTDELHTSMKGLINGTFRGVATKYLDNYVNYVGIMKRKKLNMDSVISCVNSITRESLKRKVAF
ncbi:MAG: IS1595 family transposase [Rickettsiales bacterium]|jgi:transposase-like protein|nr:IS1595 family transposase [Rickettsiales bacterium]